MNEISIRQAAFIYHEKGLKVIPVHKSKRPACKSVVGYRAKQTREDIDKLFPADNPPFGIAILCTDGIEVIDVDQKNALEGENIVKDYYNWMNEGWQMDDILAKLVIQTTTNKGCHLVYRRDESKVKGSHDLAKVTHPGEEKAKVLIETRGSGGYFIVAPTPGYQIKRGSLTKIMKLNEKDVDLMHFCASSFDEDGGAMKATPIDVSVSDSGLALELKDKIGEIESVDAPVDVAKKKIAFSVTNPEAIKAYSEEKEGRVTTWEAFDHNTKIVDILESYGWKVMNTQGDFCRMQRPDSPDKRDVQGSVVLSKNIIKVFSPNSALSVDKCHSPSSVYTTYEHQGDWSASMKDLFKKGFGDKRVSKEKDTQAVDPEEEWVLDRIEREVVEPKSKKEIMAEVESNKFDSSKPIEAEFASLCVYTVGGYRRKVGGDGMFGVVSGMEGSGKSLVCSMIEASMMANGDPVCGISLQLEGRRLLVVDTEQGKEFFYKTGWRAIRMSKEAADLSRYDKYTLRDVYNAELRLKIVIEKIYTTPNLGMVIIDGIVDLIEDYNDLAQSQRLIRLLMKASSEMNCLIVGVLHNSKSTGMLRGHLGTECANKADFNIKVEKDRTTDIYEIKQTKERYQNFPSFQLTRDDLGFPAVIGNESLSYTYDRLGAEADRAREEASERALLDRWREKARYTEWVDVTNKQELTPEKKPDELLIKKPVDLAGLHNPFGIE